MCSKCSSEYASSSFAALLLHHHMRTTLWTHMQGAFPSTLGQPGFVRATADHMQCMFIQQAQRQSEHSLAAIQYVQSWPQGLQWLSQATCATRRLLGKGLIARLQVLEHAEEGCCLPALCCQRMSAAETEHRIVAALLHQNSGSRSEPETVVILKDHWHAN